MFISTLKTACTRTALVAALTVGAGGSIAGSQAMAPEAAPGAGLTATAKRAAADPNAMVAGAGRGLAEEPAAGMAAAGKA